MDPLDDPLRNLAAWIDEARAAGAALPEAFALATVDDRGRPDVRYLLAKGIDEGLVFYTNLESPKARHLAKNPACAAAFYWEATRRQVRLRGRAEPVSPAEADAYFATRPLEARVGAWISKQSEPLESYAALLARFTAALPRFAKEGVTRPPHWGGYRLVPEEVEFWTERPHRLHERVLHRRAAGGWTRTLLQP